MTSYAAEPSSTDIAIIGMAGRFPGAADVRAFFQNLCAGVESIQFFDGPVREIADRGAHFVGAEGVLADAELFDAEFFGMPAREAELTDPQHRLFLECSWEALEDAGYVPDTFPGSIAVFGGVTTNTYQFNLFSCPSLIAGIDPHQLLIACEKDFLTTRVSYKLGLRGPSVLVQTACSTSLVAIHLACQSLLSGESDIALAGGVTVRVPQGGGYLYREGGIYSPDGHCRAFDARAAGTVSGSGVALVVLKPLAQALADGDLIYAVVKGSAINNDGADKVGYTAPSTEGQTAVIAEAHAVAGVTPESISYVEAHGTGTKLGDPVEIAALTAAFQGATTPKSCALGSLKTNVGHLDAAAGVAGVVKTALALRHRTLPPSLHFERPNPEIDFDAGPFYVNAQLSPWNTDAIPRRAGVSSFGIGGTNAHVILEEPPVLEATTVVGEPELLVLSARSPRALAHQAERLAKHLRANEVALADVAFTLQEGRKCFSVRGAVVAADVEEAAKALDRLATRESSTPSGSNRLVFAFPGQGSQHVGMGRALHAKYAAFRSAFDACAEAVARHAKLELPRLLWAEGADAETLKRTAVAQPALFAIEYALAELLSDVGITPDAMIGHSIGELVAATRAGVFSLEDAIRVVVERGRLMDSMPAGAMLAIGAPAETVARTLPPELDLAAINGPASTVVSGSIEDVAGFELELQRRGVFVRRLHTSHAFHSRTMAPAQQAFVEFLRAVPLSAPTTPVASGVSGEWLRDAEATDPTYWGRQLREAVQFHAGVRAALRESGTRFLEVGPGAALTSLLRNDPDVGATRVIKLLAAINDREASEVRAFLGALGELFQAGRAIDWGKLRGGAPRRRTPLPTYPFERRRYWIERGDTAVTFPALVNGAPQRAAEPPADPPRAQAHGRPDLPTAYVAPRTELERKLVHIWDSLFGVRGIGVEDRFFDLQGDSLLATQLTSRIRAALSVDLPVAAIFELPTVAALAVRIAGDQRLDQPTSCEIPVVGRDGELLASFSQSRFWFFEQIAPGNGAYDLTEAVRIEGPLDAATLEESLNAVIARHETLRTTLALRDGRVVQVIAPELRVPLAFHDLTNVPEEARSEAVQARLAERPPLDLANGPVISAVLFRYAERDHLQVITIHHAAVDGWSHKILMDEVTAIYTALRQKTVPALPLLPVQYADYAAWQRAKLDAPTLARLTRYWTEKLRDAPLTLELPTDRPRLAARAHRAAALPISIDGSLRDALTALGREEGATLYMVLLAVFQLLLARYSGQSDVIVGCPVAHRPVPEIERLIGCFAETLVMRSELGGASSFREHLRRVAKTVLEAFEHQDLPFDLLVEALPVPRDPGRTPVFQAMFVLQNIPRALATVDSDEALRIAFEKAGGEVAKFEFTLGLVEYEHGLVGALEYDADLYDASTIAGMIESFSALLRGVTEWPDRRLNALRFTSQEGRERLLACARGPSWTLASTNVPDAFARIVRVRGDAVAVTCDAERLSYRELDRRSRSLAQWLRTRGVARESRVGITTTRSASVVVALVAILQAGGAYVPLDPSAPRERLARVIREAGIRVVIGDAALSARLEGVDVDCIAPDRRTEQTEPPLHVEASLDTLAYMMFTSGSTGEPKGVAVTHGNVLNLAGQDAFAELQDEVVLALAPLAFDASTFEIWGCLLHGGRLVLAPPSLVGFEELSELVTRERVTTCWLTASLFREVVDRAPELVRGLRQLLTGGEVVSPEHARRALALNPGLRLINGYGPTETTTFAATHAIALQDTERTALPIGSSIAGVRTYVLDDGLEPLPALAVGELYVGGAGVARGYWNRPDSTAERFLPDPFGAPGDRMYRTGDRVRRRSDGMLDFLGRSDRQVKIRGHRVELGEVEGALRATGLVRDAAVLAIQTASGPRLTAFCVTSDGSILANLESAVRAVLPAQLVPEAWLGVSSLPRTPNGKLDADALESLAEKSRRGDPRSPPKPGLESELAGLFRELLQVEAVAADDNFFSLGGHSLLAMRLQAELRTRLGKQLPLRVVFEAPTVAAMAEALERAAEADLPPIVRQPAGSASLASFAQERLWLLDQLEPGNTAYNVPFAFRVRGELSLGALEAALGALSARHEVLRTAFAWTNEGLVQVVSPPAPVRVEIEDCRGLDSVSANARADAILRSHAEHRFDLAKGPLCRFGAVRLADTEHVLVLTMHHLVTDAWSVGVIADELALHYAAACRGESARLAELAVQYRDFAAWQRQLSSDGRFDADLQYWREQLAGAPTDLALPYDRPRQEALAARGANEPLVVPEALVVRLERLAAANGATLFMGLLAAYSAVLARVANQRELLIGAPVADRPISELRPLIGFFVNVTVLRMDLQDDPVFTELVRRARDVARAAFAHQHVPFDRVVHALGAERSSGRWPLVQALLVLQNATGPSVPMGPRFEPIAVESAGAKVDVTLSLTRTPHGLEGGFEYDAGVFDRETIRALGGRLIQFLERALSAPDAAVSSSWTLAAEERRAVLALGTGPLVPRAPACVHALLEEQADRTPGAPALLIDDRVLSYGELDARANRLARALRKRALPSEAPIAIVLPRSFGRYVALLAVLKAGFAYLALDPAHPGERLVAILDDARAAATLVDEGTPRVVGEHASALTLTALEREAQAEAPHRIGKTARPEDLAYVTYTSGSTGTPKGVRLTHRGAVNLMLAQIDELRLDAASRVLQLASMSFDASVWEIFATLACGGLLCLGERGASLIGPDLQRILREQRVNTLTLAPSLLATLAPHEIPDVRLLVVAGEAASAELVRAWAPGRRMINAYGPTEGTVCATMGPTDVERGFAPDIGTPLPNVRVHVLDAGLEPLPLGTTGELYIGGEGVARDYLERPDLTAERFVPDPFGAPGARLYRTGDRARLLASGRLEFKGRVDDQVKIRGVRVEPEEVRSALEGHPGVARAVVIPSGTPPRLTVYWVAARASDGLTIAELLAYLRRRLPEPMIPDQLVRIDSVPLTSSGKVDRARLGALPIVRPERPYTAPRTAVERAIAKIWTDILEVDRVGIDEDFFELGGHSLTATRVASRMNEVFSLTLSTRHVFEARTIARLAQKVDGAPGESAAMDELLHAEPEEAILEHLDDLSEAQLDALLDRYASEGDQG